MLMLISAAIGGVVGFFEAGIIGGAVGAAIGAIFIVLARTGWWILRRLFTRRGAVILAVIVTASFGLAVGFEAAGAFALLLLLPIGAFVFGMWLVLHRRMPWRGSR